MQCRWEGANLWLTVAAKKDQDYRHGSAQPFFPSLAPTEGVFVVEEQGTGWVPTHTEPLFVWLLFFFFIEMQTSSSFKLLQDPGTKITEKRPFFISCFAWASAAWLAIKSSLFQKVRLQFVASVAELESHLLFLANAQLSTGFRGESFSSAGVPEGSQAPRRRAPLRLTLWNQYTDSIGRRKRKN